MKFGVGTKVICLVTGSIEAVPPNTLCTEVISNSSSSTSDDPDLVNKFLELIS